MQIKFELQDKVGVLNIEGRLDAYNANELKEKFTAFLEKTVNFVFNFSKLDFIDSTGLGSVVACLKVIQAQGGDIKIAEMSEKPRMVFEITRAYKIFEIFDDMEAAILSYEID